MPSSIPYDHPSLVLGNIVDSQVLDILKNINSCQVKIDSAQYKLNSLIMMKRSIAMTMNELIDMNVDVSELKSKQTEIDQSITKSATDYLISRIQNESEIQQLREQLSDLEIQDSLESPIDFALSKIKPLHLASESLKLDSQYFSFGNNLQDDTIASIEKYIRDSTSNLGSKSDEITGAVSSQINQQIQNHSIAGTLIITASCTHSLVNTFEPLVIDPDKAISIWNSLYNDTIDIEKLKPGTFIKEDNKTDKNANNLSILTGASYGSSFIGMVHILNSELNSVGPIDQMKGLIDDKLQIGGWLENAEGGFGVDDSFMSEIKAMLSTQNVSSHVSVVVMGAIPSIASGLLHLAVNKLAEPDTSIISAISSEGKENTRTIDSEAEKSKAGARLLNVQNARIKSLIKELGKIDQGTNKILDINSMMTAFENYLAAIKNKDNSVGVPINFHLKKITRSEIVQLWQNKYYPRQDNKEKKPDKHD